MIYEGKTLLITHKEIAEHLQNDAERKSLWDVVNKGTYRFRTKGAGSWKHTYDPGDQRKCLIDYDTIPAQTITKYNIPLKQFFIDQLKAVEKAEQNWKQSAIESERINLSNAIAKDDAVLRSWYLDRLASIRPKNPKLWKKLVNDYTRLSLWMQFISKADKGTAIQYGFNSLPDFYEYCCTCIKKENLHNFNIGTREPGDTGAWKTYQVFMRKLSPFSKWLESAANGDYLEEVKRAALESLISKKFGQSHNQKKTDWHINQLVKLARDGRQLNPKMLCDDLNDLAKANNEDQVSNETVRLWLRDETISNKLFLARKGKMNWMNNKMFIITRDGASVPDAMWWIDGTPEELWWYDAKARKFNRVNLVKVLDDYSKKWIGYAFGNESMDTVYKAIKMAVKSKGTVAYQLTSDHGPAFGSNVLKDWFEKVFGGGFNDVKTFGHTPATVGLARTKIIEPYFAHFRETILARDKNHSFGNITSEGPQANPDFVKANFKDFPQSLGELVAQIERRIEMWNERVFDKGVHAGKTPNELYEQEYDDRRYINQQWFVDLFFLDRKKSRQYTPEGIEFVWNKQEYKFIAPCPITPDSPPENEEMVAKFLLENDGRSFEMKFDPDDLSKIALYYNGAFHSFAYNKINTKRALYDTTSDHSKLLQKYWSVQKHQERLNKEFFAANDAYAEAEGLAKEPFSVAAVHKNERAEAGSKIKHFQIDDHRKVEVEVHKNEDRKTRWGA